MVREITLLLLNNNMKRDISNQVIAGVCAGLGKNMGIDPLLIRLAFVLATLAGFSGLIVYIVLWLLMPSE